MKRILPVIMLSLLACTALAAGSVPKVNGLVSVKSKHSVEATIDRLEKILKKKGITIALRWRHSVKANGVGVKLRPTELLLFGNPKLGSHMFTSQQTAGIDLPLKALAWQDARGQVWLSYNDPAWIARRHGIRNRARIVNKMRAVLKKLTAMAAN